MLKNQIVTLRPDNCALMAMVHNLCANTAKKHILLSTFASGFFFLFHLSVNNKQAIDGMANQLVFAVDKSKWLTIDNITYEQNSV